MRKKLKENREEIRGEIFEKTLSWTAKLSPEVKKCGKRLLERSVRADRLKFMTGLER